MVPDERDSPYTAIDAKLAGLIATLPARPDWWERWQRLTAGSTREERLTVYQAIRDSGLLPADAGFWLVSWLIDELASELAETALDPLEDRLRAIEAAHGLSEDDIWEPDEALAEYTEVLQQYHRVWDELFAASSTRTASLRSRRCSGPTLRSTSDGARPVGSTSTDLKARTAPMSQTG